MKGSPNLGRTVGKNKEKGPIPFMPLSPFLYMHKFLEKNKVLFSVFYGVSCRINFVDVFRLR